MKAEVHIRLKLEKSVLPYLISGDNLKGTGNYYVYHTYNHSKEIASVVSGIGISGPAVELLTNASVHFSAYGAAGFVGIAAVMALRYFGGREELATQIIGQKKIRNQFRAIRLEITQALQTPVPDEALKKITEIQQKVVDIVDTAIKEDIWPYNPYSPTARERARIEASALLDSATPDWSNHVSTDDERTAELSAVPEQRIIQR